MTIKTFLIEHDEVDGGTHFTNGDTIQGRVIVEILKEAEIKSLTLIAKGYENFHLTDVFLTSYGSRRNSYPTVEFFYKVKQDLLKTGPQILGEGRHTFPFSFKIPDKEMTTSSNWAHHQLKAKLKQPRKRDKKVKTKFLFQQKEDTDEFQHMEPQHVCIEHNFKSCGSGTVTMNVYTEQMAYKADETLNIKVEINNQSTVSVRPKFTIYRKQKILLPRQRIIITSKVLQNLNKADIIAANSRVTVTKTIPLEKLPGPICGVAKNEYQLKVCLKPTRKFAEQRILVFRDNSELVPQTLAQLALMNNGMNRQPEYF
ncbi:arrestin domain-containing protein 2-like isoform X3 [Hippocampus zosterae]|uniref:arrestin domain-containing protein 2-like isoform X3 n=1 Tax=Hippocampus zosterae TaxID=109293 RepID=UPI00223D2061|nr:arrestin domain-containing protein 2-like isoform X3 [Hippocampus zosterae]